MAHLEHLEQQTGNTRSVCCKARSYCLTWNNYTAEDLTQFEQFCEGECDDYAFQEEVGEEGTPHIQAAIRFANARSWKSVKKDFPKCHIEVTKHTWQRAKAYCMKSETRVGTTVEKGKETVKDPLKGKVLRAWQEEIKKMLDEEPDDRKIYWYTDIAGGKGKTSLARHLIINRDKPDIIYLSGKVADVKCGVAKEVSEGRSPRLCIFNFARSMEQYISYEALEVIKDGIFYSGKYESGMCMYNIPHVVVMANFPPDRSKLSEDRWEIKTI